ncbi:MAG: hypothetical protein AB9856_20890 [Cellulosilyticaceae bacterium]
MDSLDLGTLKISVAADNVDGTKASLKMLSGTFREVEQGADKLKSTSQNTAKGMGTLGNSFKEALGKTSLFGSNLGEMASGLTGGAGAAGILQGAVAGLTMAMVNLAIQGVQRAIEALVNFTKQSIETASNLQESANVVDTVFGKDNKVTKWANEAASSFNLSALEAQKFSGVMGAVLTPTGLGMDKVQDMSIVLTQLSGDLGSLWNTQSEEAFTALRAAVSGETEPMKKFGVVMTQVNLESFAMAQGIEKSWKEMTQAEQAVLRYNYVLANTKTAQGDAAKTADGYANTSKQLSLQIENMKNSLGQKLLPSMTSIKQSISDWLTDNQERLKMVGNIIAILFNQIANLIKSIVNSPIAQFLGKITGLVLALINGILTGINDVLKGFNKFLDVFRLDGEKTAKGMAYEMQDMASMTKDAFEETANNTKDVFAEMKDSITGELDSVKGALTKFYDNGLKDYEEHLRKMYADEHGHLTKNEEILIAKKLQQRREAAERSKEYDIKAEETKYNSLKLMYDKDLTEYKNNESKKTAALKEEMLNRAKFSIVGKDKELVNGFAGGTDSAPTGWAVVGEHGRELMYMNGGEKVINHNNSEQILNNDNNASMVINIGTVQAHDYNDFIEQLRNKERKI